MDTAPSSGWLRRTAAIGLTAAVILSAAVGCSPFGGSDEASDEVRTLRVATLYGDSYQNDRVRMDYTDIFEFTHKNIDIEVVSAVDWTSQRYQRFEEGKRRQEPNPQEEMQKLLEGPNPPDVIFLDDSSQLTYFIEQNLLTPLDPYIQKDEFDTSGFVPAVIDGIKAAGNNVLYGLAPKFFSSALIYNKKLFTDSGVDFPEDNMSWDQVFDLASRVASGEGKDRRYGFTFSTHRYSDFLGGLSQYTAPMQLQMMDREGDKMLVDSEPWVNAVNKLVGYYKSDVIPDQTDLRMDQEGNDMVYRPGPLDYDLFLSGKAAMSIIYYSQLAEVINANENAQGIEGFEPIEWDVVTLPTHPEHPEIGGYVGMNPVMAINANAANPDDAWELIKFVNGEEWAELKSRSSHELLSREKFIKPMQGMEYNTAAFYKLKPSTPPNESDLYRKYPYIHMVRDIANMKFEKVLRGEMTVEQALKEWQTEGDAMLKQIKENPDQNPMMNEDMEMQKEMLRRAAGE